MKGEREREMEMKGQVSQKCHEGVSIIERNKGAAKKHDCLSPERERDETYCKVWANGYGTNITKVMSSHKGESNTERNKRQEPVRDK